MREFVKLTIEEAIRETLRQGPTSAGTILKAADNDTVHLHHLTQKYEVPVKYASCADGPCLAGLPSADELAGRHVHLGKIKTGADECAAAIRAGAKEPSDG